MRKYVDASRLNFRSEPRVASDTLIGILHLGQPIDGKGAIAGDETRPVNSKCVAALERAVIKDKLAMGIRSMDRTPSTIASALWRWLVSAKAC